jgi:hypothetical protein
MVHEFCTHQKQFIEIARSYVFSVQATYFYEVNFSELASANKFNIYDSRI